MACTSSRRKHVSIRRILHVRRRDCATSVELWRRVHLTGTARTKKAPLIRSRCKASRRSRTYTALYVVQANWKLIEDVTNHDQGKYGISYPVRHNEKKAGWSNTRPSSPEYLHQLDGQCRLNLPRANAVKSMSLVPRAWCKRNKGYWKTGTLKEYLATPLWTSRFQLRAMEKGLGECHRRARAASIKNAIYSIEGDGLTCQG